MNAPELKLKPTKKPTSRIDIGKAESLRKLTESKSTSRESLREWIHLQLLEKFKNLVTGDQDQYGSRDQWEDMSHETADRVHDEMDISASKMKKLYKLQINNVVDMYVTTLKARPSTEH